MPGGGGIYDCEFVFFVVCVPLENFPSFGDVTNVDEGQQYRTMLVTHGHIFKATPTLTSVDKVISGSLGTIEDF